MFWMVICFEFWGMVGVLGGVDDKENEGGNEWEWDECNDGGC